MAIHTEHVDILAEAREAQWNASAFAGPDCAKLVAPAKVNLFLGVGEKRADGFHDVTNIMHALALHDVLYVRHETIGEAELAEAVQQIEDGDSAQALAGPNATIIVNLAMADKTGDAATIEAASSPTQKNLVCKAIDALACQLDRTSCERFTIHIEKHIPAQAGLGGGSSDAAAMLKALAHFWEADDAAIEQAAQAIGADVAFFLHGGCALFDGAGENFAHALTPMKTSVVLVKPATGVPTAEAYAAFDANPVPIPPALLEQVQQATEADQVPLFNNLQNAAEALDAPVKDVRKWLQERTDAADSVLMSGSGAAVFAFAPDFAVACDLAAEAQLHGWWARATTCSSLMAARLPS